MFSVLNRFFDSSCVEEMITRYGKADMVSANNVFAHIDDVKSVCRNVFDLLNEEGLFSPSSVSAINVVSFDRKIQIPQSGLLNSSPFKNSFKFL